jgi:hypothetical protein
MMGQSLVIIPTPSLQRANHKWPAMRAISSRHMHRQAHPHVRFFSVTPFLPPVYIPVAARIFQYVETSYGRRDNLKYRIACSIDPRIGPLERAWLDHSYEWNKPGQLPAASLIPNCSTYVFARHTAELHWKSHDPCSTPRPSACEDIILFSPHAVSPICLGYFSFGCVRTDIMRCAICLVSFLWAYAFVSFFEVAIAVRADLNVSQVPSLTG